MMTSQSSQLVTKGVKNKSTSGQVSGKYEQTQQEHPPFGKPIVALHHDDNVAIGNCERQCKTEHARTERVGKDGSDVTVCRSERHIYIFFL